MNRKRIPILALTFAAALVASTSCRTQPAGATAEGGLRGRLEVERFHVGPGETVWIDDDVHIVAATNIVVEGELIARDRAAGRPSANGPRITLEAGDGIVVLGAVRGGRGADRLDLDEIGGDGSSITAIAPYVVIDGLIQGGEGGTSGPSMAGGRGGDVLLVGQALTTRSDGKSTYLGGQGGTGGKGDAEHGAGGAGGPGGAGGAGGSIRVEPPRTPSTKTVEEFLLDAIGRID